MYEVTQWSEKRFKGECHAIEAGKIPRLVSLKTPDARFEKELHGFRAIALLSVLSEWYTTVLVHLLHEEKEPIEWRSLHAGAERGVNCELIQAPCRDTESGREDRRADLYRDSSGIRRVLWRAWT